MSRSSKKITRRRFVYSSALATGGLVLLPNLSRSVLGANEKIRVAGIGCGGKGDSDIMKCANAGETIVAGVDIDSGRAESLANKVAQKSGKKPATFDDFRVMLDKMEKDIDAVTVSTPDHFHAIAAAQSIALGKHAYVQKPLTHTVYEARVLRKLAADKGVCTQMGNQGTTRDSLRTGVEIIQAGLIGDVKEVHVWSNRPVWPQGAEMTKKFEQGKGAEAPKNWNYDVWVGPQSWRPFNGAYGHFIWRGFWDFGTGALGDMACHTMNLPFWALSLEYPTSVQATVPAVYEVTPPEWSRIVYEFPSRKVVKTGKELPAVTLHWYDGNTRQGHLPDEQKAYADAAAKVDAKLGAELKKAKGNSGSLFIGSKGALYSPGDYGDAIRLLPGEAFPGDYKKHAPKPWLPRHQGGGDDQNQTNEWLDAIRQGKPDIAMSNFEYSAYFTEIILLGNLAMRVPGENIKWDGPKMKSPNSPAANSFVHHEYRKGWKLPISLNV